MSVKPDKWIRRMALEHGMIEPFTDRQMREGVISYGVSSYGYDIRVADEFRIFTNVNSTIVDPKHFDARSLVEFKGEVCIVPPNSFALARSIEYFRIPRNVLTICLGKSTYARCGIIVNVTPFEPEWEGFVTLEISNTTPLPAKIYANEGLCQVLFFESDEQCEVSYKDKKARPAEPDWHLCGQNGVGLQRVALLAPFFQAALQRADALNAFFPEKQRHTGAGGFVWSSTVEDDVAIARQALVVFLEFASIHAKGAGDGLRLRFEVHGVAQVHDGDLFLRVQFFLQLRYSDPRDAQVAEKFLPGREFVGHVAGERGRNEQNQPAPEGSSARRDAFNLIAEEQANSQKTSGPEKRAQRIEQQEAAETHVKDSRQRSSDSAEAGKDPNTSPAAEFVPDSICGNSRGDAEEQSQW